MDSPKIAYFGEEYCGRPSCECHTPQRESWEDVVKGIPIERLEVVGKELHIVVKEMPFDQVVVLPIEELRQTLSQARSDERGAMKGEITDYFQRLLNNYKGKLYFVVLGGNEEKKNLSIYYQAIKDILSLLSSE